MGLLFHFSFEIESRACFEDSLVMVVASMLKSVNKSEKM